MAYADTEGKGNRIFKLLSGMVFPTWILFMAFLGFYTPSLLLKLPFLQVKEIKVEGLNKVKEEIVQKAVKELEGNLLILKDEDLQRVLEQETKGRVKRVFLSKNFGFDGAVLKVRVQERKPVARIFTKKGVMLVGEDGTLFPPVGEEGKSLPVLSFYRGEGVPPDFEGFYQKVLSACREVRKIRFEQDRTIIEAKGKTLFLPPYELIPDAITARIRMAYNLPDGVVDLRYDRFILVSN